MKFLKSSLSLILCILLLLGVTAMSAPVPPSVDAPSVCLIEKETGKIIYEQNSHEKLAPASVTKVMTMLLVMEALDSGLINRDDKVTISAHAQSMGGSQVFLEEGEQYTVHDLMKGMVIASGNDASVALAEHISGAESSFVGKMNGRAHELGMSNTHFVNCCGLDADDHITTAHDIALMSAALLKYHPGVKEYTTIWQDTLRDGMFGLDNTNKMVRFYPGASGLKTGSTGKAKCCIAASAERDDLELIAVVMAAETSDLRFKAARDLLDFGFANYALKNTMPEGELSPVPVLQGLEATVMPLVAGGERILVEKSKSNAIEISIDIADDVQAPIEQGQKLGELTVTLDGEIMANHDIVARDSVGRKTWKHFFQDLLELVTVR
ncbi:MAG: D-alanyl-D-alanine carboxypeptidase [Oscillospiraceae bacterium]|nr:D-alanyl-D-alanine carboxypeptidase [Oscillospiraceae bacterium]